MKKVKTTKKYVYIELGDQDLEEVFASSDLIRVSKEDLEGYTISEAVKENGDYEDVMDYPDDWVEVDSLGRYHWDIPNDADQILEEDYGM